MDFEDDELPPLPHMPTASSPKRVRRRPRFLKDTVVASAVVASPGPDQVISTLIDSLTAISQGARDQLKREFSSDNLQGLRNEGAREPQRPPSQDSFYVDIPVHRSYDPLPNDVDDESDPDVAAAPVIRFTRAPSDSKGKGKKDRAALYMTANMSSGPNLSVRSSVQSLRSDGASGSMGVPSIGRPNGSSTSLTGSARSFGSHSKTDDEYPKEQTLQHLVPSRRSSTKTTRHDRSKYRFSFEMGDDKEDPTSRLDTETASKLESTPSETGSAHANSPLNTLLGRGELGDHLIPSRRSSRRHSTQSDTHESYRHSIAGSRDLKDLRIDEDLIGSDDSTIRRIRELQEARERRQSEWRNESRRSFDRFDRPSKRHSAPSPKATHRTSTYQGSKLSFTEVLVESEQESNSHPDLSARVDASDLLDLPALVSPPIDDGPLTPLLGMTGLSPQLQDNTQSSPTPAIAGLGLQIQKKPSSSSASIKRSSTVSSRKRDSTLQGDVKSVEEEVEKLLAAPRLTQKIRHPRTGRTIAFSEVGDPNGFVVFCCVGMGITRYIMAFYEELARTLKLRLITPDRPGVGESEAVPDKLQNPLSWADDVAVICSCLEISRFSLLAHSAGAIYALATALKMPQFVRGRIHLLAPWIPPSQMPKGAAIGPDSQPVANLPIAHRILSVLPAPFLKVANTKFLSATSASVETKPLRAKKLRNLEGLDALDRPFSRSYTDLGESTLNGTQRKAPAMDTTPRSSPSSRTRAVSCYQATNDSLGLPNSPPATSRATLSPSALERADSARLSSEARTALYNSALTHRIWTLATMNANPALDLLTCLERKKAIGFRYAEVTRSVVIRHGAKDGRVPLDNVRWLQSIMKRCELRVLEDEGHSLMSSASVMSSVLSEIAREWDEWQRIAKDKEKRKRAEKNNAKETALSLRSVGTISVRS